MDRRYMAGLIVIIVAIASVIMISALPSSESEASVEGTPVIQWAWIIGGIFLVAVLLGFLMYFQSRSS
ncbi:MAG: hypothetical protein SVK08_06880 [Halobacteriota archaeon]|nr:hypothetical protein [Halobacteriota archaeon]